GETIRFYRRPYRLVDCFNKLRFGRNSTMFYVQQFYQLKSDNNNIQVAMGFIKSEMSPQLSLG
ncbi:MAG: hypothetical protein Q9218_005434, partial [Villophora microphyllina]